MVSLLLRVKVRKNEWKNKKREKLLLFIPGGGRMMNYPIYVHNISIYIFHLFIYILVTEY